MQLFIIFILTAVLTWNSAAAESKAAVGEWVSLFNGRDLSGWEKNDFAGAGPVEVKDGKIILNAGVALTGIKWTNELPTTNYEILVKSTKLQGNDFFSAITFPVKDSHGTFINGGWGGALVGFSSIDGMDASENDSTSFYKFEVGKPYTFKIRVLDRRILGWINGEKVMDALIADRKVSMRAGEIEDAAPFGLTTFMTTSEIDEVKIRRIPADVKKVAFIAGQKSHGPGEHEYEKGLALLQEELEKNAGFIAINTDLHVEGWPIDDEDLTDADTIVLFCDGSDHDVNDHPVVRYDRYKYLDRQMKRGAGLVCLHYSLFVPEETVGPKFLEWIGGFFDYETGSGENKWYSKIETREFEVFPASADHPIAKGLDPFKLKEEYYFNIRFPEQKTGLTPILTFDPEKKDLSKVVAWAFERPNGGRGFGYTGGHFHSNWENEEVRRTIINAITWTAKATPHIQSASK